MISLSVKSSQLLPDLEEILKSSFGIKRAAEMKLSLSSSSSCHTVACCDLVVAQISILSEVQQ